MGGVRHPLFSGYMDLLNALGETNMDPIERWYPAETDPASPL